MNWNDGNIAWIFHSHENPFWQGIQKSSKEKGKIEFVESEDWERFIELIVPNYIIWVSNRHSQAQQVFDLEAIDIDVSSEEKLRQWVKTIWPAGGKQEYIIQLSRDQNELNVSVEAEENLDEVYSKLKIKGKSLIDFYFGEREYTHWKTQLENMGFEIYLTTSQLHNKTLDKDRRILKNSMLIELEKISKKENRIRERGKWF